LRKRRLLIIFLAIFAGAIVLHWALRDRSESNYYGIQVWGSKAFIEQVDDSLNLLRTKSPEAFALIQRYMKRIEQSSRSGMRAYDEPPTFDLSPKTAFYSATWCAGSIAHDMYHSRLYHEYIDAHGEPVPEDAWAGQAKELECIKYQARVMRDIGAPEFEVTYVDHLDGSHYDVDGDGKETWFDYWLRDW
jgi:hypothetical protein